MHAAEREPPLVEPFVVADQYVSGLHSVDKLTGGNFRFNFYVDQVSPVDGRRERVIVSRLVAARVSVVPAVIMVARAIGFMLMGEVTNQNTVKPEPEE